MSWDEMREMMEEGMSFGNHSHTHPTLTHLATKEQIKELKGSKEILEKELKEKIKLFSYPYGSFDETVIDILRKQKCICGLTTDAGINVGSHVKPFALKRLDTNDLPFE